MINFGQSGVYDVSWTAHARFSYQHAIWRSIIFVYPQKRKDSSKEKENRQRKQVKKATKKACVFRVVSGPPQEFNRMCRRQDQLLQQPLISCISCTSRSRQPDANLCTSRTRQPDTNRESAFPERLVWRGSRWVPDNNLYTSRFRQPDTNLCTSCTRQPDTNRESAFERPVWRGIRRVPVD